MLFLLIVVVAFAAIMLFLMLKQKNVEAISASTVSKSKTSIITKFLFGFILIAGLITSVTYPKYKEIYEIQHNGHRETANFVRTFKSCDRGGCSIDTEYRYAAPDPTGKALYFTGTGYMADGDRLLSQSTGHVPIVYDPDRPEVSRINAGNRALVGASEDFLAAFVPASFLLAIAGGLMAMLLPTLSFRR